MGSAANLACTFLALLGTWVLLAAPSARASTTLGQTSDNSVDWFTAFPFTEIQTGSARSPSYTVPAGGGVITSWSNQANAMASGFMQLKVFHPTSQPDRFEVIAESALEPITSGQLSTFPTHLQVQAGDVLGYSRPAGTSMSAFFFTEDPGDTLAQAPGADDAPGSTTTFSPAQPDARLDLSAVLRQPPTVSSIEPSSGPIGGGTQVTISGHDFTEATAVDFGSIPAAGFTVDSESKITVTAPPSASIGAVDVSVTTALGTTPAGVADRFTYTACLVPRLKGKKLKGARMSLAKAGCRLGKARKRRGATTRTGKVVGQSPKPGKLLALGAKVNVKLGR